MNKENRSKVVSLQRKFIKHVCAFIWKNFLFGKGSETDRLFAVKTTTTKTSTLTTRVGAVHRPGLREGGGTLK